jgi:hypothetical protein
MVHLLHRLPEGGGARNNPNSSPNADSRHRRRAFVVGAFAIPATAGIITGGVAWSMSGGESHKAVQAGNENPAHPGKAPQPKASAAPAHASGDIPAELRFPGANETSHGNVSILRSADVVMVGVYDNGYYWNEQWTATGMPLNRSEAMCTKDGILKSIITNTSNKTDTQSGLAPGASSSVSVPDPNTCGDHYLSKVEATGQK